MLPESWMQLLTDVCAIDSRTEAAPAGATRVAERFGKVLEHLGFTLSWHEPAPQEGPRGQHLRAVRHAGAGPRLLLLGHTDTVLAPAEVPWRVDAAQGKVFGSGVCDMKGGIVLLLAALEQALAQPAVARRELVVLLNSTEEVAGISFPALARQAAIGALACLSFEPARAGAKGAQEVVISRKGVCRFALTCTGRAAHSGIDHAYGVSAVRELARKVELLEALTDYSRDLTINVGFIEGGRAVNQVPEYARLRFDLRAFDPAVLAEACQRVRKIAAVSTVSSPRDGATTTLTLDEFHSYPTWPLRADAQALAERYRLLAQRRGLTIVPTASGGGADASHVADLTPTLDGLGILGGNLHQTSEWADLSSWAARVNSVADLLVDLCQ